MFSKVILITLSLLSAILMILAAPIAVSAQNAIPPGEPTYEEAYVPCGTKDATNDGIVDNPCGFNDVIEFARRAITGWIMAGAIVAALGFAYAGYLYITAMGSEEKISHAHMIFVKTFWGFVFMLSAWLIAKTMESIFLTPGLQEKSFLHTAPPAGS